MVSYAMKILSCKFSLHLLFDPLSLFFIISLGLFFHPMGRVTAETGFMPQGNDIPWIDEEKEQMLDDTQKSASDLLLSAANWLDSFFDDERYLAEENTTRAKLRLSFEYSRNDGFDIKPRVSWRIRLPRFSKKALLVISAADDDDFSDDQDPAAGTPGYKELEKNDLNASLKYFLKVGKTYNLSTTFGASFNYLYGGLRYRYLHDFGPWQGRFLDTIRYYTNDGWENKVSIDMERHFSKRWFFRTTVNASWYENDNGLPHSLHFQLYQVLNREKALMYEVGNFFDRVPSYKMTNLQLILRYRQRFYRDWLVLEIAPQVSFPEDHDRKINPGIVVKFEADFGYMAEKREFKNIFGF